MLNPLKIDHNIIPEDVIRQYKINKPRIISATIFESVVAELLVENTKYKEEITELNSKLKDSYSADDMAIEEAEKDEIEDEKIKIDEELTKLKTDLATYLANCTDNTIEEAQTYFNENLEELVDEYAE